MVKYRREVAEELESLDTNTFDASADTILLDIEKAEDVAFQDADKGVVVMAVRDDTPPAAKGANNDYMPLLVDATGQLYVVEASASGIDSKLGTIDDLVQAEDDAYGSTDKGILPFALRRAIPADQSSAEGDYEMVQMDEGLLWVRLPRATTATKGGVDAAATTTLILAANATRKFATFVNDSDETVYLALGQDAALNQGIRLNANGGGYEINATNLFTGAINGISTSGSKKIVYTEG